MTCILGVDPGASGALAFYFPEEPARIAIEDMPVANKQVAPAILAERIKSFAPTVAAIELVNAMPGQGVSSTFSFGVAFGMIRGVIGALNIPVVFVTPAVWKRHFKLSADKEQARALALHTFPTCSAHFARKMDHGRAEAALIARWAAETQWQPRAAA